MLVQRLKMIAFGCNELVEEESQPTLIIEPASISFQFNISGSPFLHEVKLDSIVELSVSSLSRLL